MTMNNTHDLCVNIINFPRVMSQKGDVSFYSLLKKIGYFEMHDQITVKTLREALLEYPGCVNDWIQFSEDQRCSPAWFFRQNGTDYEVGYWSSKADDAPPTKYSDSLEACAIFIKHKIEGVRLID